MNIRTTTQETLKSITQNQINTYYDTWQVKYLPDNKVEITDRCSKEIRTFQIVPESESNVKIIKIKQPIPKSIDWHRLTNWKCAKELYTNARTTWDEFKEEGLIPERVIADTEGRSETHG